MIIKINTITLPDTTEIELEFEPNVLYDKPSITGRLHRVYKTTSEAEQIIFSKKFKLTCIGISKDIYDSLHIVDGSNTAELSFENMQFVDDITDFDNPFTESFLGTFSMTFSKYESSVFNDVVIIEFNVTQSSSLPPISTSELMFISDLYVVTPPTISHIDDTIVIE